MTKKLTMIIPRLYGLFFLVMGLNFFFNFIALPPSSMQASNFLMALANTGYMFPIIGGLQIVTGLMLVLNWWTPLALVLLAPLVVNIVLFHLFLDTKLLGLAIVILIVEVFLAGIYWENFSHLFKKR